MTGKDPHSPLSGFPEGKKKIQQIPYGRDSSVKIISLPFSYLYLLGQSTQGGDPSPSFDLLPLPPPTSQPDSG